WKNHSSLLRTIKPKGVVSEDDLLNANYRQFSIPEFLIENGLANPKSGGLAVVISILYKTNKVFRMRGRGK
ncbi:hypothetical protein PNQ92_13930, partial [Halobacterium salinarum]|uniref:hypothetical protein n=1 Tax=Halobacterium salinarum TaxID=2242 RepID=UPI002554547F